MINVRYGYITKFYLFKQRTRSIIMISDSSKKYVKIGYRIKIEWNEQSSHF